jgi:hypothetical protein
MSQESSSGMTQARFAAIVDAYGGDVERWPRGEREAAESFLAANSAAQLLVSPARRLDGALGVLEITNVSSALERRLLDDFDRAQRRWSMRRLVDVAADAVWPGAPVWQPACALGLAFAAGLGLALFAPFDIPQRDDAASSVFTLDTVSDVDAGHGI